MQPDSAAKLSEPERAVFGNRKFYSVTLNMPNLNSAGGSWVVRFAELKDTPSEGQLFSPRDALQVGLVHEVVPEAELFDKALARAQALAALWPAGVRQVKSALRAPVAARIREVDATQSEKWVESWLSAEPVLRATVARLKK